MGEAEEEEEKSSRQQQPQQVTASKIQIIPLINGALVAYMRF